MNEIRAHVAASTGLVRSVNEDSWYAGEHLFVVADGMGGHAAGDVASRLVVDLLTSLDREGVEQADVDLVVQQANAAVLDHARRHPEAAGMGTTVCGLVRGPQGWLAFNVGDSRCYEVARGILRQVTVDHSEVQELVDLGQISREEARVHPRRNVVTRAVGQVPAPVVDFFHVVAEQGSRFLVTSDGVTLEVRDGDLARMCAEIADGALLAQRLVQAADDAGGFDNATAIVIDDAFSGEAPEPSSSTIPRDLIVREVAQ